jgi:chemotaxis protein MotA
MSAIAFMILGLGSVVAAYLLEGGHFHALLEYTAAVIVFGGTMGAVGLSFPLSEIKRFPAVLRVALSEGKYALTDRIMKFIDQSAIARREGVLALERMVETDENMDHLTRVGLRLVVDGVEPELVREVMESYVDATSERHKGGAGMLESAGGFAPTMGIIGTVMGLVHVLGNLSDPDKLGPSIAVAFIATLYGVGSANLLWLPLASKLKNLDKMEKHDSMLVVEGVMLIAKGSNPRMVEEKLQAFLDPKEMEQFRSVSGENHGKAA